MTLTEEIYEAIRNDIINLRIKPGERLSEARLARKYNVSRAPIRNVLQKLQQEEFVLVKPQVGTIIMPVSYQKAKDVLEIRLLLEPYAAAIAARNITREDLSILEERLDELESKQLESEEKKEALFATDSLLHQTIWRLSGNREIANIINNYKDEIQRIRLSTLKLADRLIPSAKEMRRIFQDLKSHDPERARESMRQHIANIMNAIETGLKKEPVRK